MMLQRAIESKFLLMMIEITVMNEAGRRYCASLVRGTIYTGAEEGMTMATVVQHRKVNIVVLEQNEDIKGNCRGGDIAILADSAGWWVKFIGAGGQVDCYGIPYASYNEALWAAKAAAEFGV
jgi:hypothetical protein